MSKCHNESIFYLFNKEPHTLKHRFQIWHVHSIIKGGYLCHCAVSFWKILALVVIIFYMFLISKIWFGLVNHVHFIFHRNRSNFVSLLSRYGLKLNWRGNECRREVFVSDVQFGIALSSKTECRLTYKTQPNNVMRMSSSEWTKIRTGQTERNTNNGKVLRSQNRPITACWKIYLMKLEYTRWYKGANASIWSTLE